MELTIDQALQKGIEAQKAGKVQEADRLYTAILKAQPKHPDANHKIGMLAVDVGKVDIALPFLKTALEANPKRAQFWLSYIEALIQLGRSKEAKVVLAQAKSIGANGDDFAKLETRIKEASRLQSPSEDQVQSVINFYSQGQFLKARKRIETLIKQFPNSSGLFNIQGAVLRSLGQLDLSIEAYKKALVIKPDHVQAHYNLGISLQDQDRLEEAIEAYQKAIDIQPNYAAAYYNMGNAFQEQSELEKAVQAYKKALTINNDYAEAYNNMGISLQKQGRLVQAIEASQKAIDIQPDFFEAYNNMGISLQKQGRLEEAIVAYQSATNIKPDHAWSTENFQALLVQLSPIINSYGYDPESTDVQINSEILNRPKYQIQNVIKAYLKGDFAQANSQNDDYKAFGQHLLGNLNLKDKVFCNAYSTFIGKLLDAEWNEEHSSKNKVYHLGESHSLSYAHRNVTIAGLNYKIVPRIIFGAKAFHLSQSKYNGFKAITKAHFASLPRGSKVFLSYGEIDCRPNEGFISAAKKHDKSLEEIIDQTTKGYVKWLSDLNADRKHKLYFFNVPAPVYNKKHSADLNSTVAKAVVLFNATLRKYSLQYGFETVDVFKFTAGNEGFSNSLYHVDEHHLGAKALEQIQRQLS